MTWRGIESDQKDSRLPWIMIGHGRLATSGGERPITQNRRSPGGARKLLAAPPHRIQFPVNILPILNRSQDTAFSRRQCAAELIELTCGYEMLRAAANRNPH